MIYLGLMGIPFLFGLVLGWLAHIRVWEIRRERSGELDDDVFRRFRYAERQPPPEPWGEWDQDWPFVQAPQP